MIGPGTGIAPFMAFSERFRELEKSLNEKPDVTRYLLYGSTDLTKEYIFRYVAFLPRISNNLLFKRRA